jgi:hypothetical protein
MRAANRRHCTFADHTSRDLHLCGTSSRTDFRVACVTRDLNYFAHLMDTEFEVSELHLVQDAFSHVVHKFQIMQKNSP